MVMRCVFAVLAVVLAVSGTQAQAPAKTPTDLLGDPLPSGAVARLGTLRFKHDLTRGTIVNRAIFSPDGTMIAAMAGQPLVPGSTRLWNATTGQHLPGAWDAGDRQFTAVAFSPDSSIMAGADMGRQRPTKEIVLWLIASGKTLQTLPGNTEFVQAMAFTKDGKTLIAAGNGVVRWWDVTAGKELRAWRPLDEENLKPKGDAKNGRTFFNCCLSPDGLFLAVEISLTDQRAVIGDGQLILANGDVEANGFNLDTRQLTWRTTEKRRLDFDQGTRFAFSPDGKWLAIADGTGMVGLRNTSNGKLVANAKLPAKTLNSRDLELEIDRLQLGQLGGGYLPRSDNAKLALSSAGNILAFVGNDGRLELWEQDGTNIMGKHRGSIAPSVGVPATAVVFSPDGKNVAVAAGAELGVYDAATLKDVVPFDGHHRAVTFVNFAADGKTLLTGTAQIASTPNNALAWNIATWKPLASQPTRSPKLPQNGIASHDQKIFAGISADKKFGLYDLANGALLSGLSVPKEQSTGARAFFSSDGQFYVLPGKDADGKNVQRLFRVSSGKLVCVLSELAQFAEPLLNLTFSADGRLVAGFSVNDGKIDVIEMATGKVRHRLGKPPEQKLPKGSSYVSNVALSVDGKLLASWTAADNVVRVWETATGKQKLHLPYHGLSQSRLYIAWSPDNRTLAVGDQRIRLWEVASGKLRHEFTGRDGDIRALAFSPDGRLLASASVDSTVLVWDATGKR